MSPARAAILSLVSGIPSQQRYGRLILMLQGYFDGSTQDGEFLVLAGYIADCATWLPFSDEWKNKTDKLDNGRPFKMGRASKTAKGMRRAKEHYDLISKYKLIGVGCAVPIKQLKELVSEFQIDPKLSNPYYIAWRLLITTSIKRISDMNVRDKIQFCFDEQTEKVNVIKAWDLFHKNAPAQYRKYISKSFSFQPDDEVMPLQAADLLAWFSRRQYLDDPEKMGELFPSNWNSSPNLFFTKIDQDGLRRLLAEEVKNAAIQGRIIAGLKFSVKPSADKHFGAW